MDVNQLLTLIQRLYAAPGDEHGWQTFLVQLCAAVNGSCAHFIAVDRRGQAGLALTVNSDPDARAAYDEYWGGLDPWGHSQRLQSAPAGAVLLGDEMVPHAELQRTPYYNDFGRPIDLVRCMAGAIDVAPANVSVVSIGRGEHQHPFDTEERTLLHALMPHLQRALALHRRIATAESSAADFAETLARASRAVLFVDVRGRVTWMNPVAERLVAGHDGLIIQGGELRASRASDTTALRRLLADAVRTSCASGLGAGGTVSLGRSEGRRPLMAMVAPLTRRSTFFSPDSQPAAVVIVSDPESSGVPDDRTISEHLGLTPAEAALTRLLAQGLTLTQAADRLGLRIGSVRTRAKAILEKTNTHRQADLVRLVLTLTPKL